MRHVVGLFVGVVVTAVLLLGAGWAVPAAMRGAATLVSAEQDLRMLLGLGAMGVAGLVLGLVLAGRISPLATFVPAMALLAWTVVYALDVNRAMNLAPVGAALQPDLAQAGRGMQVLLSTGTLALIGVALFIPVLMPSRWARRPEEDEDDFESGAESFF